MQLIRTLSEQPTILRVDIGPFQEKHREKRTNTHSADPARNVVKEKTLY